MVGVFGRERGGSRLTAVLNSRRVPSRASLPWLLPASASILFILAGLVFSFGNLGLPGQAPGWWFMPTDLWATWHNAQFVSWGRLGQVYAAHTQLMALPGIAILLSPLAWLADKAGLHSGWPIETAHPGAWLVLDPAALAAGSSVLWALDLWARKLGLDTKTRAALLVVETAVTFVAVAPMGHPEDLVALALLLYAMDRADQGRFAQAGWLAGAALATQQLAALGAGVVVALAISNRNGRSTTSTLWAIGARAVAVPGALAAWCLIAAPGATWSHLVAGHSSNPWPTPLGALAPGGDAGPLRLAELLGAAMAGVALRKGSGGGADLVWWTGIAFSMRVLEPLQTPYYLTPAMALFALAAFAAGRWQRAILTAILAAGIGIATGPFQEGHPWALWITILAFTALAAAASAPFGSEGSKIVSERPQEELPQPQ